MKVLVDGVAQYLAKPTVHPLPQYINDWHHEASQWNVLKIENNMYQGWRDEQQHSAKSPCFFCNYCKAIEQLVTSCSDEPAQIGFDHVHNFSESIKLRRSFNIRRLLLPWSHMSSRIPLKSHITQGLRRCRFLYVYNSQNKRYRSALWPIYLIGIKLSNGHNDDLYIEEIPRGEQNIHPPLPYSNTINIDYI